MHKLGVLVLQKERSVIQVVSKDIFDLTHLSWSLSRSSSGTAGSFLKAYEEIDGKKYYYKLSNFDTVRGIHGHECINEIIAQNLADALGIPHLAYDLLHAKVKIDNKIYETWLTRTADFKREREHKLTFETYYEINRIPGEEVWPFIVRSGLEQYFYEVFLLDYLICNRDRHGANIEVLEKQGKYRLAPVFDNGLSLLFSCYGDGAAMEKFDYLKDGPVNNFVGSMSLSENLKLVPQQMLIAARTKELGENILFRGLEMLRESCEGAVPNTYWNCVRKMIIERRDNIEKIFAER